MVKKKPQDKIQLVEDITDNETKIKSNEEKEAIQENLQAIINLKEHICQ